MCLFRGHADAHKSSSSSLRLFQGSIFLKHSHILLHSSTPGSFFFSHRISLSQSQQTTSTSTSHLFTGGITGIPPAFFPRKPKPFSNRPSPTPGRFFFFCWEGCSRRSHIFLFQWKITFLCMVFIVVYKRKQMCRKFPLYNKMTAAVRRVRIAGIRLGARDEIWL